MTRAALYGRRPARVRAISRSYSVNRATTRCASVPRHSDPRAALVPKGSPDSGARCEGRELACGVRDERRAGTDGRAKSTIGRTPTLARISIIVLCPALTVYTRTVWMTSCSMRRATFLTRGMHVQMTGTWIKRQSQEKE